MAKDIAYYTPYASTLVTVKIMLILLSILITTAGYVVGKWFPTIFGIDKGTSGKPKVPASLKKYK